MVRELEIRAEYAIGGARWQYSSTRATPLPFRARRSSASRSSTSSSTSSSTTNSTSSSTIPSNEGGALLPATAAPPSDVSPAESVDSTIRAALAAQERENDSLAQHADELRVELERARAETAAVHAARTDALARESTARSDALGVAAAQLGAITARAEAAETATQTLRSKNSALAALLAAARAEALRTAEESAFLARSTAELQERVDHLADRLESARAATALVRAEKATTDEHVAALTRSGGWHPSKAMRERLAAMLGWGALESTTSTLDALLGKVESSALEVAEANVKASVAAEDAAVAQGALVTARGRQRDWAARCEELERDVAELVEWNTSAKQILSVVGAHMEHEAGEG